MTLVFLTADRIINTEACSLTFLYARYAMDLVFCKNNTKHLMTWLVFRYPGAGPLGGSFLPF
jgi:hypothetical protein